MKTHSEPRCLPRVAAQLIALGILTLAGAQSFAQTTGKTFAAAAVKAQPGLQCTLHPAGSAAMDGITLFTNADGYARFHAVKASANDVVGAVHDRTAPGVPRMVTHPQPRPLT